MFHCWFIGIIVTLYLVLAIRNTQPVQIKSRQSFAEVWYEFEILHSLLWGWELCYLSCDYQLLDLTAFTYDMSSKQPWFASLALFYFELTVVMAWMDCVHMWLCDIHVLLLNYQTDRVDFWCENNHLGLLLLLLLLMILMTVWALKGSIYVK